jgi:hypothetical protein
VDFLQRRFHGEKIGDPTNLITDKLTVCSRNLVIDHYATNSLITSRNISERWGNSWLIQRNPLKLQERFKKLTTQSKLTKQEFRTLNAKRMRGFGITISKSNMSRMKLSVIPDRLMSLSARFDLLLSMIQIPSVAKARLFFAIVTARLKSCPVSKQEQPQVLRLRLAQRTRQTPLRMTEILVVMTEILERLGDNL